MNRIHITRIIPVNDQILLIIFKNSKTKTHDAKFLLHSIPEVNPKSDPEGFKAFLHKNKHIISKWEQKIKTTPIKPGGDTVTVTLSFPEDEWNEINSACTDMNITVEQLAIALANFSVEPGADKALDQWYTEIMHKYSCDGAFTQFPQQ